MRLSIALLATLVLAGCAGVSSSLNSPAASAAGPSAEVLIPASTPLTAHDWIVFTDNGIREMRTRFESFATGRTPGSQVAADIAYFEREIARIEAIDPDPCWADMHAAYGKIMRNAKALLDAAYAGDMTTAKARYAETGTLNDNFDRAQEAVALDCL